MNHCNISTELTAINSSAYKAVNKNLSKNEEDVNYIKAEELIKLWGKDAISTNTIRNKIYDSADENQSSEEDNLGRIESAIYHLAKKSPSDVQKLFDQLFFMPAETLRTSDGFLFNVHTLINYSTMMQQKHLDLIFNYCLKHNLSIQFKANQDSNYQYIYPVKPFSAWSRFVKLALYNNEITQHIFQKFPQEIPGLLNDIKELQSEATSKNSFF